MRRATLRRFPAKCVTLLGSGLVLVASARRSAALLFVCVLTATHRLRSCESSLPSNMRQLEVVVKSMPASSQGSFCSSAACFNVWVDLIPD